ncbi:transcriptional regulator GlxA family with amidase domain [Pedobacter cryoconitis]|uniref:Transcriptional regulator GlxA family with amidase domain n=1 Tax=Pedobacter cryoconitis TaxID=188932 RepID=A0A7W8ZPA8_9SPHI|nr:helix-turn-helix domain-containing protein [Pedobacter cryoconitis]MBB5637696.1 transcriptional regulator GlxA family with amidase domain [Pedobacter cryoconitis]
MKQISFLLIGGQLKPSSLFGAIEVFEKANQFLKEKGQPPCYKIQLVGEEFEQPMLNSFFSLHSLKRTSEIKKTDCIIIPAFEPEENAEINYADTLKWLVDQYKNGAEIASLCSGVFLLAASGLLDGKPCSTHWRAEAIFKKMFPKSLLLTDKIITDHQGIYTSGGAMSAFNLCLYLVEKHNGREAALFCTKLMQLDIERHSQSPFQIFTGLKNHADEIIRDIQNFIELNTSEKITVDFLAAKCNMDRVNFSRRFKKATQLPPVDYIQQIKIEAAKRALETGSKNINEIMYSVGYIDAKAFRTIFKKITGLSPTEYKAKFSH